MSNAPTPSGVSSNGSLSLTGTNWTRINGIGQTIISALTILGGTYLLHALIKQGRGKLRVRLLLGMVAGDLLLGVCAFVPNIYWLAGGTLMTGSDGCDVQAFFLTAIIFSQHLYTLLIAIATFSLLKHPLSRFTYSLERYSWAAAPVIWSLSFIHSGGWWAGFGWSNSGSLCTYKSVIIENGLDARDLMQFIPRALVFVTILILYSMLFNFLRRPDTITLSSQFVSGGQIPDPHAGATSSSGAYPTAGRRKSIGQGLLAGISKKVGFSNRGNNNGPQGGGGAGDISSKVDESAPWEQLEFVQIGRTRPPVSPLQSFQIYSPSQSFLGDTRTPGAQAQRTSGILSIPSSRPISPLPSGSHPSSPQLPSPDHITLPHLQRHRPSIVSVQSYGTELQTPSHGGGGGAGTSTPSYSASAAGSSYASGGASSHRPSEAETLVTTSPLYYHLPASATNGKDPLSPVPSQADEKSFPDIIGIGPVDLDMDMTGIVNLNKADPPLIRANPSLATTRSRSSIEEEDEDEDDKHSGGQTMKEFFQAFENGPVTPVGGIASDSRVERGWGSGSGGGGQQMSATAYFNRQASLLMLYFPLAYLFIFSVSLGRLVYGMVHNVPNPLLAVLSSWMVLSMGLVDAIVYGLAEFIVKRRVRRKMGDRL